MLPHVSSTEARFRRARRTAMPAALSVLALTGALLAAPRSAQAQQVYVGSANGWQQMIDHPDQWTFVRQHADGFYVNFIQMLRGDVPRCAQTAALFTHKNAIYESDSRYTGLGGFPDGGQFSLALQASQLRALLSGGFAVPYASLNYGLDAAKEADLKQIGMPAGRSRPCLTQIGPWTYKGDIANAKDVTANIARSGGASTDGPLSLWQANQGMMQEGSCSLVKYVHARRKIALVMVAPYNLKPTSPWLSVAQQCVRQHENHGASPTSGACLSMPRPRPLCRRRSKAGLPIQSRAWPTGSSTMSKTQSAMPPSPCRAVNRRGRGAAHSPCATAAPG